jgi:hypothetical protein
VTRIVFRPPAAGEDRVMPVLDKAQKVASAFDG